MQERTYTSDVVLFEEDNHYSRDAVTITSGAGDMKTGTVLSRITASGEYTSAKATGSDGSQTAVAVLLEDVDASVSEVTGVTVLARHAQVKRAGLTFDTSINTGLERAAAEAQLKDAGIQVRASA